MIVKSTLRVSLLKGDHGNVRMADCLDVAWWLGGLDSHLVAEALRALMLINEMGTITPRQTSTSDTILEFDANVNIDTQCEWTFSVNRSEHRCAM